MRKLLLTIRLAAPAAITVDSLLERHGENHRAAIQEAVDAIRDRESQNARARTFYRAMGVDLDALNLGSDATGEQIAAAFKAAESARLNTILQPLGLTAETLDAKTVKGLAERLGAFEATQRQNAINDAATDNKWDPAKLSVLLGDATPVRQEIEVETEVNGFKSKTRQPVWGIKEGETFTELSKAARIAPFSDSLAKLPDSKPANTPDVPDQRPSTTDKAPVSAPMPADLWSI